MSSRGLLPWWGRRSDCEPRYSCRVENTSVGVNPTFSAFRRSILEFADVAAVKRWYDSPEYRKICRAGSTTRRCRRGDRSGGGRCHVDRSCAVSPAEGRTKTGHRSRGSELEPSKRPICHSRGRAYRIEKRLLSWTGRVTCKQGSVYDWYLVDIGIDRDFPVLPNGNDNSSVDVSRPNVISPISRSPWHGRKVSRKSYTYPPQTLLRRSRRF